MDKEVLDKLEQIKKYTLLQAKNYLNVEDLCNYIPQFGIRNSA